MKHTINNIISRIYGHGRGWCFTSKHFSDLGSPEAIRLSLYRLEKRGAIRRLARGLYDYPKKHSVIGQLSPSPEKIARAISERDAIRIQPSGAYTANLLGLTEQVPAKSVYLTDGPSRTMKIGSQEIVFKKTTARNLATAGKFSGALFNALKYIGREQISIQQIESLKNSLEASALTQLEKDRVYSPNWM
ncbi:MAG: DUF6088 family protein, partial [Candidatus Aminicenantaceae bacterium]